MCRWLEVQRLVTEHYRFATGWRLYALLNAGVEVAAEPSSGSTFVARLRERARVAVARTVQVASDARWPQPDRPPGKSRARPRERRGGRRRTVSRAGPDDDPHEPDVAARAAAVSGHDDRPAARRRRASGIVPERRFAELLGGHAARRHGRRPRSPRPDRVRRSRSAPSSSWSAD